MAAVLTWLSNRAAGMLWYITSWLPGVMITGMPLAANAAAARANLAYGVLTRGSATKAVTLKAVAPVSAIHLFTLF